MNSIDEAFSSVKQYCRKEGRISEAAMKLWIDIMKPVQLDGSVAVFTVQSEFQKTVVMNTYNALLKEAFLNVLGLDVKIQINVVTPEENDNPLSENSNAKDYDELARRHEELEHSFEGANYEYTFATFIVGGSNEFAYAACTAVAKEPGKNYNPLFIYGPSGLGKTHLMHAIANQVHENHPEYKIIYVTSEEFGNDFLSCINDNNMARFHDKYRNADVLLIDDIQFFSNKERMQEEFFHTFNKLHAEGKQIVITSDKPPKELKTLEERIRSRFEWGLIADITLPDYETRMAILHKKEEMDGYDINEEVIKYIANNIKSNIRELEGAINKVMAFAKLEKKEVTLELAEQALKDIISPDEKKVITPDYIISMVAEHFDVTVDDLCGNKRNSKIVTPRQIAMYLCREIISTPLKSIGKCLGNRDHTTIMHGIDKIEKEINNDENLKNTIETLKKKINPQG